MEPELEEIIKKKGRPPSFLPTANDIDRFRRRWAAGAARFAASPLIRQQLAGEAWVEREWQIRVRDRETIKARSYAPRAGQTGCLPLFVMFHGGGYCLGGLDTEEAMCQIICSKLQLVVLNVDYRLAPEHLFPVCVEDCIDSTAWAANNAASLGCDLAMGFIVGGMSGGATFASVIAHVWRGRGELPSITGVCMANPILENHVCLHGSKKLLFEDEYKSKNENRMAPVLDRAMTDRFWSLLKPDLSSPLYTSFLFDSHANLPPTYLQASGLDPFRDGCRIYLRNLRQVGVETRFNFYAGLPHSFWTAYPNLRATKRWLEDTLKGISWLLEHVEAHLKGRL